MSDVLKVLLVEDNPGDARLIQEMLRDTERDQFQLEHEACLQDALGLLGERTYDLILLDLGLPDSQGLDTFSKISAQVPDIPILVLSGFDDEAFAIEAVRQGAQDYLAKGRIDESLLVRSMHYSIERKRLLIELTQSQQNELQVKNQFISYVSHELRSPLTALYQFITILLDGIAGEISSEQREYLEISLSKIKELQSMVGDLREATRAQTGRLKLELKKVSLSELIDETLRTFEVRAKERGIQLSCYVQDDLPTVYADPERVIQILSNLIDNAIKFTPEAGTVSVETQLFTKDQNFACVSVADTGHGIAPEDQGKIFEYQFQVKTGQKAPSAGLGLGLYICRELALGHGGEIWVESEPGHGSTFFITLPVFTLQRQLASILSADNLKKGSIAIISIELSHTDKGELSKKDEPAIKKAFGIVQSCIRTDTDVMLPLDMTTSGTPVTTAIKKLFVVASADRSGGQIIVKRIRKQLRGSDEFSNSGLEIKMSLNTLMDMVEDMESKPIEQLVEDIVVYIEDLMKASR
jgi:signal transduction histidine kinase